MEVWPAIDLRGGKCVRLRQGDYGQETVFGDDPAAMARRWCDAGADRLHLVDLDGARHGGPADGQSANLAAVRAILDAVSVPCQLGGGIRDELAVRRALDLGVSRLIVGTRALRDEDWFRGICRTYPEQLVLGIDARDGRVAIEGWTEVSDRSAIDLARSFSNEPLAALVVTDISKDGMLAGPNLQTIREFVAAIPLPIIASGGVTSLDDVRQLRGLGASGCIIGRALYEGQLRLEDALRAARGAA
jgi:phosphoribosylformimino-5-aminoimidazole carboxamide ribotide isomerase